MNRRQIFAVLAALPIVGKMIPAVSASAQEQVATDHLAADIARKLDTLAAVYRPSSLAAYRDLLLPGLRGALRYPVEADIQIDFLTDTLLVMAVYPQYPRAEDRLVIGVITRENLSNHQWSKFQPLLSRMREVLFAPDSAPVTRITMDEIT
jgi:hypothetical protein